MSCVIHFCLAFISILDNVLLDEIFNTLAIPKNYIPISLVCHTYKLIQTIILNRIAPLVEQLLIKEQISGPERHAVNYYNLNTETLQNYLRIAEQTHIILQIQKSACKPRQRPSYSVPHEEQRGEENVKGKMKQDRSGEYNHLKYIGVTLDRTLSYKQHIHNTKMKVATRNNLLRKLPSSKWGANASTIITLRYSVAEYAAPVWVRSALYLLSGIAPPSIRRGVCARVDKQ